MSHLANSKLIDLIQLLSTKEFKDLEVWIDAPWHKKNKYILPFYHLIQKAAPDYTLTDLSKQDLFHQLYGNKPYNNRIFNNLILAFTKSVEQYLAFLQLKQQGELTQQLLGKALANRKSIKYFEQTALKLIEKIEQKKNRSSDDYLLLKQLNHDLFFQASMHHRYQPNTPFLNEAINNLNAFYLQESYLYLHELATRTKILKLATQSPPQLTEDLLRPLQKELKLPTVNLYEFRLDTQLVTHWEDYLTFKALYQKAVNQLPYTLKQAFLFYCINDVIDFNSKGYPTAIKELFEWYQFGLKHELLSQNGMITGITYNNIILTASNLLEHKFLVHFIEDYTERLPKFIQEIASTWAKAQLSYTQSKYEETVEQLKDWSPKDTFFAIQAKVTLLKASFKLVLNDASYLKTFENYCSAFDKYMQRNKLYSVHRNLSYQNYIKLAKKVAQLHPQPTCTNKWVKLEKEMEAKKGLFGKSWLEKEIRLIKAAER